MGRAARATINLEAIRHNYRWAKSVAPGRKALAIIKANAYGHGAVPVARALTADADGFGVACIEEAIELRDAGITRPILLLEGFFAADELSTISESNLWCTIHSREQIDILACSSLSRPINIWLKMDSGMHRLGIAPGAYVDAYQRLRGLPQVNDLVVMSHFACADEPTLHATAEQISCVDRIFGSLDAPVSLANSAAILAHPGSHRDWQRPGIMIYGASPFSEVQPLADQLQPAMGLSSEVIAVRRLQAGDAVGYGATWVCERPSVVGTVALGYGDGYDRHARNGTPVLVDGQRTQVVGRVSMDMLSVDLTAVPGAAVGSKVELWGENLLASEVAKYCDTIPYTLFTGITGRVRKAYTE